MVGNFEERQADRKVVIKKGTVSSALSSFSIKTTASVAQLVISSDSQNSSTAKALLSIQDCTGFRGKRAVALWGTISSETPIHFGNTVTTS